MAGPLGAAGSWDSPADSTTFPGMSNTFGEFFRITTWGESHGPGIGVVIDGIPPGIPVDLSMVEEELRRRRPGGPLASPRKEPDQPRVLSGLREGRTLGTPLALWIENRDARPGDYEELSRIYRPGHADLTTDARYGLRDPRGGGRAGARETSARVAAGAVARQLLALEHAIEIVGWVERIGDIDARVDPAQVTRVDVEASPVRCPDPKASVRMVEAIERSRDDGDSLGGWVGAVARGVPPGWGDPVFAKIKALLAGALLSIPAAVAFEVGEGRAATRLRGSENNDPLRPAKGGGIEPATNRSGGLLGGITTGAPLVARVGFKPTSTIRKAQTTVDMDGQAVRFEGTGRHDPCVLPRAVAIAEAMLALVLADRMLARRATPPHGK
ncbi:MAG: chorismate synthase [Planctomycetota bacterium]